MFSQSADEPAADQTPAPVGMRELPPQPAKPVMPAYTMPVPSPVHVPASAEVDAGPGPDDSVIARDDHFEGTFTSRGTVVVIGSVKGRIEAVRVRIESGAHVDADVLVDEAIVAGEFTGNLTCRERLEARASGRISGRVETFRLMLHEGASVEGEMHMLAEAPRDATTTIRGSAPPRGETGTESKPGPIGTAATSAAVPASAKTAPTVTPSSAAKSSASAPASGSTTRPGSPSTTVSASAAVTPAPALPAGRSGATPGSATGRESTTVAMAAPGPDAMTTPRRSPVAEALRLETLLVAPRAVTGQTRSSAASSAPRAVATATRTRNGTTTGF